MADDKTTATTGVQLPCGHCGDRASLGCGQCKNVRYCSPECQLADWQFHKSLCKNYIQAIEKGRPNFDVRLAILIKEGESEPAFCWIPVESGVKPSSLYDGDDDDSDIVGALAEELGVPIKDKSLATILPTEESFTGSAIKEKATEMLVCGKRGSGKLLSYSIHVATGCPSLANQAPNKYLAPFFGDEIASQYRGNTSLYAMTKVYDSSIIVDIDTCGLTLALDALAKRYSLGQTPRIKTTGVRVNAMKPHYEQIDIPIRHPIFLEGNLAKVPSLLGENLLTYKPPTRDGCGTAALPSDTGAPANPAAWLLLECKLNSPNFGYIPPAVKTDTGSILVASRQVADDGGKGRLSSTMLKSLIGVLKYDVQSLLIHTSQPPEQRCMNVIKYNICMRKELTDNMKRNFDDMVREQGLEAWINGIEDDDRAANPDGRRTPDGETALESKIGNAESVNGKDAEAGEVNAANADNAKPGTLKDGTTKSGSSNSGNSTSGATKACKSKKANAKARKRAKAAKAKAEGTETLGDKGLTGDDERDEDACSTRLAYYFDKAILLW